MCDALELLWPGVPDLNSLSKVIEYFAENTKTSEEAVKKASQYVKDRAFTADGSVVNPNKDFEKAVVFRFKVHHQVMVTGA